MAVLLALAASAWRAPGGEAAVASGPALIDLIVPQHLVAGGAPGIVVAQVRDADGAPVADGITVTFTASLGVVMAPVTAATEGGLAVTTAHPSHMAGFAQITARAGDARDDQLLYVRPGPAAVVATLLALPDRVPFAGTAEITLRAEDAFGQPAEGDAVAWSIDGGTLSNADARLATGAARATAGAAPGATRMVVGVAVGNARGTLVIPVLPDSALWRTYLPAAIFPSARGGRLGAP